MTDLTGNGAYVDDYWYVLPGYKFVTWNNFNYTGSSTTMDNTLGSSVKMFQPSYGYNSTVSVQVYYNNVLVTITSMTS